MSTIQSRTPEKKGQKTSSTRKIGPAKKRKEGQEKRKKRGGEKAKSKSQHCCVVTLFCKNGENIFFFSLFNKTAARSSQLFSPEGIFVLCCRFPAKQHSFKAFSEFFATKFINDRNCKRKRNPLCLESLRFCHFLLLEMPKNKYNRYGVLLTKNPLLAKIRVIQKVSFSLMSSLCRSVGTLFYLSKVL